MLNKMNQTAKRAMLESGKMLLREFARFDRGRVNFKKFDEIVTRADLDSEKIIIDEIRRNFPDHRILSEEKGSLDQRSDYLWIVDPIDGTTNFTMHNPIFSISVGLAFKSEIIAGFIYAPFLDEFYLANKGKGANMNGKKIKVSKIKGLGTLHAYCHGHEDRSLKKAVEYYNRQKLKKKNHCRQLGSAAIELAFVAAGRLESITIPGVKPWDVAAGILMVREAGGRVSDFTGQEWNLNSADMIASNGIVHKEILELVK
jgi:myo-inositol-1(or 4)-monophosphatase